MTDTRQTLFAGYHIGDGAYGEIKQVCPRYGSKAVIIGGEKALAAAEEKIRAAVANSSIEITGTCWYGGEASYENMNMLMEKPEVQEADMIFAVGGGKAIDTCKVLAHKTNRPFFTFPTIASTCAACTSLGIIYHPDGSLNEYSFSKVPANHIFIDPQIIAEAPKKYLWAGIGDTMAKFFEATTSSRDCIPEHSDAMGISLSRMCADPMIRWGVQALEACEKNKVTDELVEVILGIIISTGIVSNFVQVDYTTGLAHAVYNGFTVLPEIEKYHHLHGEVVSYGILILLTVDKNYATEEKDRKIAEEKRNEIFRFNRAMGLPTKLSDMNCRIDQIEKIADKALQGIDVRIYPYEVTKQMICEAILEMEEYNQKTDIQQ
ncbi:MAG: iron-containing alcohol dehydrogenase family protein [Clostridiales bacterium]|nr:iron-containing alcohol dehydrogenase family protein [Clostridiales bacterium]